MKGYFSQLVRRTGLTVGPRRAPAPGGFPAEPSGAARDNPQAGLTPLHAEDVVFTSSSPGAGVEDPRGGVQDRGRPGADSGTHPPPGKSMEVEGPDTAVRQRPGGVVELSSRTRGTRNETPEVGGEPPLQEAAEGESGTGFRWLQPPGEERQSGPRSGPPDGLEKVDAAEIPRERRGNPSGRQGRPAGDPRTPPAGLEEERTWQGAGDLGGPKAPLGEPVEKEAAFAAYLQEIRAWAAVTPENEGRKPGQEGRAQAAPPEESSGALAAEREKNTGMAPAAMETRDRGSQDLTVSIGTISVVIEEPAREAAAPPAIPSRTAGKETEPAPGGSTSWSRYYLRKW